MTKWLINKWMINNYMKKMKAAILIHSINLFLSVSNELLYVHTAADLSFQSYRKSFIFNGSWLLSVVRSVKSIGVAFWASITQVPSWMQEYCSLSPSRIIIKINWYDGVEKKTLQGWNVFCVDKTCAIS